MVFRVDVVPEIIKEGEGITVSVHNPLDGREYISLRIRRADRAPLLIPEFWIEPAETKTFVISWETLKGRLDAMGIPYLDLPLAIYAEADVVVTKTIIGTDISISGYQRSNAVAFKVTSISSSPPKIKFIDETGAPIPYFHCMIFDHLTKKVDKYVGDGDGIVTVPTRVTDYQGRWTIELVKLDYDRRLVAYAILPDYDFTDKVVQTTWSPRVKVDMETEPLPAPDDAMKAISDLMPEPLRTVTKAIAGWLGWLVDRTTTIILSWFAFYVSKASGGKVTSMTYDPDTKKIKMSVAYDPFLSSLGIIGAIIAILALIAGLFVIAPAVIGVWKLYKDLEIEVERTKQREAEKTAIDTILEALREDLIGKEAAEEAIKNITEAMRHARESTPPTLVERIAVPGLAAVGGAVIGGLLVRRVMPPR